MGAALARGRKSGRSDRRGYALSILCRPNKTREAALAMPQLEIIITITATCAEENSRTVQPHQILVTCVEDSKQLLLVLGLYAASLIIGAWFRSPLLAKDVCAP